MANSNAKSCESINPTSNGKYTDKHRIMKHSNGSA